MKHLIRHTSLALLIITTARAQAKITSRPAYTNRQKVAAYKVLLDADLTDPGVAVNPDQAVRITKKVNDDIGNAADTGALPLVAEALLRIQGDPPFEPTANGGYIDQAREQIARLADFAKLNENNHFSYACHQGVSDAECRKTPISDREIRTAIDSLPPTGQKPDTASFAEKRGRGIPVDSAGAYVFTAVDTIMNPQRYAHRADGSPDSIAEAAAEKPVDPQKAVEAVSVNAVATLGSGRSQGARFGLQYLDVSGVRYDGSQFLGAVALQATRSSRP